jgi:hypothetical protein
VFHEHIWESPREQVAEEQVELVRLAPLSLTFDDDDPADARVARAREPETCRNRREHAPGLRIWQADGVENTKGEDELAVHRRVKGHESRMAGKCLCVWNTKQERRCQLEDAP